MSILSINKNEDSKYNAIGIALIAMTNMSDNWQDFIEHMSWNEFFRGFWISTC